MPSLPADVITLAHRIENFLGRRRQNSARILEAPRPSEAAARTVDRSKSVTRRARPTSHSGSRRSRTGTDIAVLSEAGCPAIADPGATLVAAAHRNGWKVQPLVGPSSIMLALMASGLEGQRFRFVGYLPISANERVAAIQALERESNRGETQIFIETPYRNAALFEALLQHCQPATRLAVAVDLTGDGESAQQRTVREWRSRPPDAWPPFVKQPAVFCLLA